LPKKKIAEKEPVSAVEGALAAASVKGSVSKARAPRASANAVTHKHKKATIAATPVEPVVAEIAAPVAEPTYEEISKLAYSYWVARGYQGGSQEEDWFRATDELRNR
jgi:hypothetical protein